MDLAASGVPPDNRADRIYVYVIDETIWLCVSQPIHEYEHFSHVYLQIFHISVADGGRK
jgi:hypothetical protein